MEKRALIFGPHPDDAELAMGGTILRMIADGWEVILADLTNGEPTPAGSVEKRAAEAAKAGAILGVHERICLGFTNRYLMNTIQARNQVAEVIRKYRPKWLFVTYRPDAHPDHIHAAELVEDARFTAKLTKTDLAYEPHYAKRIFYYYANHLSLHAHPRFVVDVSEYWDRKMEAVRAYRSQFWDYVKEGRDREGWIEDHLSQSCGYFGSRVGVKYAEPFYCHELVGLAGVNDLL